ncbi:hypothetical protein cand_001210 [Cryptosporidium andersoni]|uniref:Uncharacterized protein n=1 Tax=Cryptosporidium andersoni TaxID=117008 RepID=A0A1J4MQZ3_9CRYT|nr:hypothetical protein cand_001210 [Cryptosporidium andersoni]
MSYIFVKLHINSCLSIFSTVAKLRNTKAPTKLSSINRFVKKDFLTALDDSQTVVDCLYSEVPNGFRINKQIRVNNKIDYNLACLIYNFNSTYFT